MEILEELEQSGGAGFEPLFVMTERHVKAPSGGSAYLRWVRSLIVNTVSLISGLILLKVSNTSTGRPDRKSLPTAGPLMGQAISKPVKQKDD